MSDNSLKYAPRTHVTTVIVGAGQAGMSASYYLCQSGIDHVVLERYKRFHAWKEDRWDSFCLVTPNWQCKLPDFPYRGEFQCPSARGRHRHARGKGKWYLPSRHRSGTLVR